MIKNTACPDLSSRITCGFDIGRAVTVLYQFVGDRVLAPIGSTVFQHPVIIAKYIMARVSDMKNVGKMSQFTFIK